MVTSGGIDPRHNPHDGFGEDIEKKDLAKMEAKGILKNNCLNIQMPVRKSVLRAMLLEDNTLMKEDNIP